MAMFRVGELLLLFFYFFIFLHFIEKRVNRGCQLDFDAI